MTLTHLLRATGRLVLALLIPFMFVAGGASLEAKGSSKSSGGKVTVKGHVRKDGTYVPPHTRSAPGTKSKAGTGEAKRAKAASARATANGVYVASVNRVGHEAEAGTNGLTFFGNSFVADPFGRYLAQAGEDLSILLATCDPALIETVRRNWPFLRDRRVDAYGPILNRFLG